MRPLLCCLLATVACMAPQVAPTGSNLVRPRPAPSPNASSIATPPTETVHTLQVTAEGNIVGIGPSSLVQFTQRTGEVLSLHFDSIVRSYALNTHGSYVIVGFDDSIEVWSTTPPKRLHHIEARAIVEMQPSLGISEDEHTFFAAGWCFANTPCSRRWTDFVDVASGAHLAGYSANTLPSPVSQSLSADGRYLLHRADSGNFVIEARTGKVLLQRRNAPSAGFGVAKFSGERLILARREMVEIDDLASGQVLRSHRYASDESPSHLVALDQHAIFSFLPKRSALARWDYETDPAPTLIDISTARDCPHPCRLHRASDPKALVLFTQTVQANSLVPHFALSIDAALNIASLLRARFCKDRTG